MQRHSAQQNSDHRCRHRANPGCKNRECYPVTERYPVSHERKGRALLDGFSFNYVSDRRRRADNPQCDRFEPVRTLVPQRRQKRIMADVNIVKEGNKFFVEVDGVRIAQRGSPDFPQAETWVSIEPGWEVVGSEKTIAIRYNRANVH
jgi:hypothetical protein